MERATLLSQTTLEKATLLAQVTALEQQIIALTALVADNEATLAEKETLIVQGSLALTQAREQGQGLVRERERELEQRHQAALSEQTVMMDSLRQQLSELRSASTLTSSTHPSQMDQSNEVENALVTKHNEDETAVIDLQKQLADLISSSSQDKQSMADLQAQLNMKNEEKLALVRRVDELSTIETRATQEILELQTHAQRSNDELVTARGKYTDLIALSAANKVAADKQIADLQTRLKMSDEEMKALAEKHTDLW